MSGVAPEASQAEPSFTEDDFIHGHPETMIQADTRPKVLIVWPHGDETLGPRLGYRIQSEHPDLLGHVDYMCGNPYAASKNPPERYIETDLNRSFNPAAAPASYEEKRAQIILDQIEIGDYDYVLDVHTSTTDVGRFFLANHRTKAVDTIIAASPLTRIVMMPDHIAQAGLIGQVPNAVSIEYDRRVAETCGVEESLLLIDGLVQARPLVELQEREFFYVTRPIPKTEDPGLQAPNFKLCADGYYPVLFGQNSYRSDPSKPYLGFAATSREVVTM